MGQSSLSSKENYKENLKKKPYYKYDTSVELNNMT